MTGRFHRTLLCGLLTGTFSLACGFSTTLADDAPAKLTYEEHIRPIFRAHCFDCHGATDEFKGKLDLRLVRSIAKGGESGPAIVPGKPDESYLLQRVRSGEMPPGQNSLPAKDVQILEAWIASGAKTARPEPESIGPGLGITPEERAFWFFQPIRRPDVSEFPPGERIRTPIDALLRNAMPDGLAFSPDADRDTLIKRAFFNVIGLPPTPEQMQKWLAHERGDWFEHMVDELLDSPHYGERWARHWLDAAGYADSEGYHVQDAVRNWAWRYRDYVIKSLNNDKPFDRFLIEQLAGDELVGEKEGDWTAEQIELLSATGFLRMAADGTGQGNTEEARNQVVTDTIGIIGSTLLGLSVKCAQCHDHRYDPIPQTDYYAIRAIFEPALDYRSWKDPNGRRVSLMTQAERTKADEIEKKANQVMVERNKREGELMNITLEEQLKRVKDESLHEKLRVAWKTAGNKRTDEQKKLLETYPFILTLSPGSLYLYNQKRADELKAFNKKAEDIRKTKPPETFARALVESPGHLPETKLFHRGDFKQPKQTVEPAALTVSAQEGEFKKFAANDESIPTSGRRLAFAKWLTSGKHPLFGRVIANRIWMHHFGRGIVSTPGDFGKLGTLPTHPRLLDWLASEFAANGWSLKKLHRTILLSTAWRQSSFRDPKRDAIDPDNRFYWRKSVLRLDAEVVRDRMLAASGRLDRQLFGNSLSIKEDDTGQIEVSYDQTRRSLYIQQRRSQPVAMLQAFDAPVMETNCDCRPVSTVATQSLMLMNGEFTLGQAKHLALRAAREPAALSEGELSGLPNLGDGSLSPWKYGYGSFDESNKLTKSFTPLPFFNGSSWQGGEKLPDPKLNWCILHANGGHPGGGPDRAVIRRWTAPASGKLTIAGKLHHGSENGDGVRGRIVSSRARLRSETKAFHGTADTNVAEFDVETGETIDFITDAVGSVTSDSFNWQVTLTLKPAGQEGSRNFVSSNEFGGPVAARLELPKQVVRVWELALNRKPAGEELHLAVLFLAEQLTHIDKNRDKLPKDVQPEQQAMTNLCQALLGSNEFLYVD